MINYAYGVVVALEFSSLNDSESFVTGGKNSELDDLINEIEKEAN